MKKLFVGIAFLLIAMLTFTSFLYAFALDEGTLGDNVLENFLAESFTVFRFPTHPLLWSLFDAIPILGTILYFPGLLFNALFYGVLFERLVALFFLRKEH